MNTGRPLARALYGGWKLFTVRSVSRSDFVTTAELFALLVALDLLLTFAFSFAVVGLKGEVNPYELPRLLMFVPLVLALALLARRHDEGHDLLLLPVALAAATIPFTVVSSGLYLLAQHGWLPFLEIYWSYFDYLAIAWSAVVIIVAVWRLVGGAPLAKGATALAGVVLLVLPAMWLPQGLVWTPQYDESAAYARTGFYTLGEEKAFYAQHDALDRELSALEPERRGIPDVYVVAAGLYAGEDVFMKEIKMVTGVLGERFDARGRTVTLINNAKTLHEHPVASLTSVTEALRHVGELMNTDEDVLVLYLSSHGSEKHELAVDFRPMRFVPINPPALKSALDESGIRWKVIVISACYSGGFIEALKDEHTIVITASGADRQSFGCGAASEATYLAQALFGVALKNTYSFEAAFERARGLIEQWEREKGYAPSEPQLYAGAQIRAKLAELERRLAKP